MGLPFLSTVFGIIKDLMLAFWNLPFSDLGFSFGSLLVFFIVIKFVSSILFGQSITGLSGSFYSGVSETVKTSTTFSVNSIEKVRFLAKSKLQDRYRDRGN